MTEFNFKERDTKPIKALAKTKLVSNLANIIVKQPGLVGVNIVGNQQTGKSTYALWVMYELYKRNIDEMLKHIVFSMDELTELLLKFQERNEKAICVMWDDASVSGSAGHWVTDPKKVIDLSSLGDTMGTATKGILITSPSGDLIKAFRNYNFYKAEIKIENKYKRMAKVYKIWKSPLDQQLIRHQFDDFYDIRSPFYERYAKMRQDLSLQVLKGVIKNRKGNKEKPEVTEKKRTIKERVLELRRDFEAGVFGDDTTFKKLCRENNINYRTAFNYL